MGQVSKKHIEHTAKFLFYLLRDGDGTIEYSRFYDGTSETSKWMADILFDDKDHLEPSVELCLDLAASQLERQGVVVLRYLNENLADGEPDYIIALTKKGWQTAFSEFSFRGVNRRSLRVETNF